MLKKSLVLMMALTAATASAQTATEYTPPPMVPATPPPMPAPEPTTAQPGTPGTPPPPSNGATTPYAPGQGNKSAYPYSPYGQPKASEKPGPEIGLMVSEALFGSLTAAGVTVLPYFLLFANGTLGGDKTISSVVFCLIFGAAPLAVAQTQVSLANGSRYYQAETWIPALVGLAGMGGVLGIFAASAGGSFWLPTQQASDGVPNGGSVAWLMIGSIGVVPLLQMAAINLFKQPKPGLRFAIGDPEKKVGIAFAPPMLAPVVAPSAGGTVLGAQLSLLNGRF